LAKVSFAAFRASSTLFTWSGTYFIASAFAVFRASSAALSACSAGAFWLEHAASATATSKAATTERILFITVFPPPGMFTEHERTAAIWKMYYVISGRINIPRGKGPPICAPLLADLELQLSAFLRFGPLLKLGNTSQQLLFGWL
jgi:hypothetical protein